MVSKTARKFMKPDTSKRNFKSAEIKDDNLRVVGMSENGLKIETLYHLSEEGRQRRRRETREFTIKREDLEDFQRAIKKAIGA